MTGVKGWGFPVTRKREARRRSVSPPLWFWLLALAVLLWTVGATRAWPQNSGSSLSSSADTLTSWNELFGQGRIIYERQKNDLEALKTEIGNLKTGSERLTLLSTQLSKSNGDLSRYNAQMAQRMQERDEELTAAYDKIGRLEQARLRLIITVIVMAAVIVAGLLLIIIF